MSATDPEPRANQDSGGLVKAPQDLAAGLFLVAVALVGYFGAFHLRTGTLGGMGPGLLPKVVALTIGAFGLFLIVEALTTAGGIVERWSLRGPFFVLGAALVFAATIRGSTLVFGGFRIPLGDTVISVPVLLILQTPPLGLVVSGPLAVIVAACADKGSRIIEVIVFAAVMTILSIGLFKYLLNLPIP